MVTHPYFTEQTIAKEQGIIGQEIKMYDDSPDWRLITGLFECLYHSHPIRSERYRGHGGEHCGNHAGDALRQLQSVLCTGQHGAGGGRQHHHGADSWPPASAMA